MHLARYKTVLALPGMRTFMLVSLLARIPGTAWTTALTLSLVLDEHRSYADAGAATAAYTVGVAVGAPLLGRVIDRRGPRPVLLVTGLVSLTFWNLVPSLPYPVLLGSAVVCGVLQVPVQTLVRRSLAVRVPEYARRQAFSLDSMAVELSFMIGPALAVVTITQLGEGTSTLRALGLGLGLSAAALYLHDRRPAGSGAADSGAGAAGDGVEGEAAKPRWFAPSFLLILGVCATTCMILAATDVSIVAVARAHGQIEWASIVAVVWAASSLVGGFIHGAMRKPLPMTVLLLLLGALSLPLGLAANWWTLCLLVVPAGIACAPTIASTVDAISRAIPASHRGQAIGLHAASLTTGAAIGAPLVGVVIDQGGTGWGMAAIGALGCSVALAGISAQALRRRGHARARMFEDSFGEAAAAVPVERLKQAEAT